MTELAWTHVFIDVPADDVGTAQRFWAAVTGWSVGEPWAGHPEFTSLIPADGDPYVHVQRIGGPPRIHIDFAVDRVEPTADRLTTLGAGVGERMPQWQVMASPGGLPFCLAEEAHPHRPPPAARWPAGHRSRLGQVCIDAPRAVSAQEYAFWQAVTGWHTRPSEHPAFHGKLYPPAGGTAQLLLQRLGDDDTGQRTRAHIDLVTDDVDAEVRRVVAAGASVLGPGEGWVALEDPVGLSFCVTDQPGSV